MDVSKITALATAVIAFVTVIATMVGFWLNLRAAGIVAVKIIIFEMLFVIAVILFISEIKEVFEQ